MYAITLGGSTSGSVYNGGTGGITCGTYTWPNQQTVYQHYSYYTPWTPPQTFSVRKIENGFILKQDDGKEFVFESTEKMNEHICKTWGEK